MQNEKEMVINLSIFKIPLRNLIINFFLSLFLLILFAFLIFNFIKTSVTYETAYKIKVNPYKFDEFITNYDVINVNLFGDTFDYFKNFQDNQSKIFTNSNFFLNQLNNYVNNELKKNNYIVMVRNDLNINNSSPNIELRFVKKFQKYFKEETDVSNIKSEIQNISSKIFENALQNMTVEIHSYHSKLFKLYKKNALRKIEILQGDFNFDDRLMSADAKNQFIMNLIFEFLNSSIESKESIEESLKKSDVFMKIINQVEDLSLTDITNMDKKFMQSNQLKIEKISNLQYNDYKQDIDFIYFDQDYEKIKDKDFFNINIIFLLLIFFMSINFILLFISKLFL
tara:strand:- start:507 stop:1526 length:1020 start_codon:yes stop_codon:yes gene_type:complete